MRGWFKFVATVSSHVQEEFCNRRVTKKGVMETERETTIKHRDRILTRSARNSVLMRAFYCSRTTFTAQGDCTASPPHLHLATTRSTATSTTTTSSMHDSLRTAAVCLVVWPFNSRSHKVGKKYCLWPENSTFESDSEDVVGMVSVSSGSVAVLFCVLD